MISAHPIAFVRASRKRTALDALVKHPDGRRPRLEAGEEAHEPRRDVHELVDALGSLRTGVLQ